MSLSVVLPTYNERENIVPLVTAIMQAIPQGIDHEILVVDDNSPDQTYQAVCEHFTDTPQVRAILRTHDRGFAKSIRAGIEQAQYEKILVLDADFTHDPAEIPNLLHISERYDIVSGSRFCSGGRMQDTPHYLASMLFNWLVRLIVHTQVQDNLGGFFIIDAKKLRMLPCDRIFEGYGEYFIRLLFYAKRCGYSIVEIPAIYATRVHGVSKSKFLTMLYTYTRTALRLRMGS